MDAAINFEAGRDAHCKRVAAWCAELAQALGLPLRDRAILQEAALRHHQPIQLLRGESFSRLLGDLKVESSEPSTPERARVLVEADKVLAQLNARPRMAGSIGDLAEILEIADHFDEQLEHAPYEERRLHQILATAELDGSSQCCDPAVTFVREKLRKAVPSALPALLPRLPV
ncbi:MAG: hypothetical protein ACRD7E_09755, partial [Bryobacteraceae bacterium]